MVFDRISDDIPPLMKMLNKVVNKVVPILMHFCSFVSNWHKATRHPAIRDVINDVKLF